MAEKYSNNKRIAKNTVLLYIQSFVVMIVALYTSRIILQMLGVADYGLYNVIGGVVGLFAFLRTSMTKSTQRFLNFEMARLNGRLKDTFSVSLTIHVIISLLALIFCETIGLWFLDHYIQIPEGRKIAANVVFQSTVFSLFFTILSVPYNASIIAHEKMGYFAIVSIIDAFLKLSVCYLIQFSNGDKLVFYGWLIMGVSIINFLLYVFYCFKYCPEVNFKLMYDKKLFKEMISYTSWTVIGQAAIVGTNQGNNILINMFHSVTANAAMGVASQINHAVVSLTSSFQTAFNPQITKSFASKEYNYLKSLVFTTSKISFSLLTIVSIPIAFNINVILYIWLGVIPKYSDIFVILVLCNSILNALSTPLNFTVLSSRKIKNFQIITSIVYLSDLPFVYILFCMGLPPTTALVVKVCIMFIILAVRLFFAYKEVPCINMASYAKEVGIPLFFCSLASVISGLFLFKYVENVLSRLTMTFLLTLITLFFFYVLAFSPEEKQRLKKAIQKRKKK